MIMNKQYNIPTLPLPYDLETNVLRSLFDKQYKHELLNNLFFHPYTKIEFMVRDMMVERRTASRYLNMIVDAGLLHKEKIGKVNYYINTGLINLFLNHTELSKDNVPMIELVSDTIHM